MAATVEALILRFPEFARIPIETLQVAIDEAKLSIDRTVWDAKADIGTLYLAAHALAISPFGMSAKLVAKDGSSVYEKRYLELRAELGLGFRVL